jgi:hypothetical protein
MNLLTHLPAGRTLGVVVLLAAAVAGLGAWRSGPRPTAMDDWEIEDVVARLREKGLEFRTVPGDRNGNGGRNMFLTTTDKSATQLCNVGLFAEHLDRWHGTVICKRESRSSLGRVRTEVEGDCYLCIGPFLFFGDPDFRAQIQKALGDGGSGPSCGRWLR